MNRQAYRFRFQDQVDLRDAQETLMLTMLAAEGLFGRSRVRCDAVLMADESINALVIDASTVVGITITLIFTAFIATEFGPDAFDVRRVELLTDGMGRVAALEKRA